MMHDGSFAARFSGIDYGVRECDDGNGYDCLVFDFGPNVVAYGHGRTPSESVDNTRKVGWGYRLRLDYMIDIPKERREQIGAFLKCLSGDQKTMICELLDQERQHVAREQVPCL